MIIGARDTLEIINSKTGIDDDLKLRTRYRLGIEYRAEKEYKKSIQDDSWYKKSIKMFSSIPDGDGSWHKDFGLSTTKFIYLRSENFEEFKGEEKRDYLNKIVKIYEKFQSLTKNNKDALSIQCLGAEFSAFAILKYKFDADQIKKDLKTKLIKLFINSFREASRISEQQIGSSAETTV
jgi:hypothetical protein